jgi:transcriptional regulator with XRE-family HTH domain
MSRLKEIRESSGLSQSKLAEDMNISVRSLQAYEQGKRNLAGAKLETILKACTSLKCSLEDMFRTEAEILKLLEKYEKQQ